MPPIQCWYFAIGQYDGVALPRFLCSRRATLRRPRRRPYQRYKVLRRSTGFGFTAQRVWSTLKTPHSSSICLFESLPHTDPGPALLFAPPIRDQSYHGPKARLKGEGRVGHCVAPYRRQLFFLLLFLLLLDHQTSVSA